MPYPVRYYCPRCETVATLQRSGSLADKSVTPYPLEGWRYAAVGGDPDAAGDPYAEADGVRIVCGEREPDGSESSGGRRPSADGPIAFDGVGCGEPYYLNFVRFEEGREVDPEPAAEHVTLAHPRRPRGPRGPSGPPGPGRSDR